MVYRQVQVRRFSVHLLDTRGHGLASMMAGYKAGVEIFDVAAGGLGGGIFAVGASGKILA